VSVAVVAYRIGAKREVAVPRMRIAVVADLHACWPVMGVGRIERIVAQANGLGADLICLLGDYVGHVFATRRLPPEKVVPPLTKLAAPLGVFAVFGNHDWIDDESARKARARETVWHRAFGEAGIATLSNATRRIESKGVAVTLAGIDSQRAYARKRGGAHDLGAILAGLDPARFTILLAHEPDIFPELPDHVDLTLAGHTHGGQIRPLGEAVIASSRYGTRYAYGHVVEGARQMVVSGGLGYSGIPVRFRMPAELTVIDLG
jgi:uncharacterized protein